MTESGVKRSLGLFPSIRVFTLLNSFLFQLSLTVYFVSINNFLKSNAREKKRKEKVCPNVFSPIIDDTLVITNNSVAKGD